nr:H/ACA RNA-protein complex protein Gar1 [Candidatus Korarchaeota archaeon]
CLGYVLHITSSRNLILKAETLPKIGVEVVDKNLNPVGSVFEVFGPVSSPYVTVKPEIPDPKRLVNNMLYTPLSTGRKEKRKYGR